MSEANKTQVGGDHYRNRPHQVWDLVIQMNWCFFQGNIVKYVDRFRRKNGVEDLKKARHYLDKLIEIEEAKFAAVQEHLNSAKEVLNESAADLKELEDILKDMDKKFSKGPEITAAAPCRHGVQLEMTTDGETRQVDLRGRAYPRMFNGAPHTVDPTFNKDPQ